jgi:hypothetical protein
MASQDDEADFYAWLRDASNACLEARRCVVVAIDKAPDGEDTKDLWNCMDALDLWADWLNPSGEDGYGGPTVVRFPIERRG